MPASPCTITGLRASLKHHLEQWWRQAKRHAVRTWPDTLIDSPSGVFFVIKTVKSARFANCLSHGNPGQASQIRVHGMMKLPRSNDELELPINGTQWYPVRNELAMDLYETERRSEYTIFIERESSLMFRIPAEGGAKEAAQKYWKYAAPRKAVNGSACTATNQPQAQQNQWGAPAAGWNNGPAVNWPQPNLAPPPAPPARPNSPATFDGKDTITLKEGWFLIKSGEGDFLLEFAGAGLDLKTQDISSSQKM